MKPTFNRLVKHWQVRTAALLMLLLLISMIGCNRHYVVVSGDETITVKKSTVDNLYSDNERLLKALEQCGKGTVK